MVRSVKKGPWLINYEVSNNKVIKLLYSSKGFIEKGWSYQGRVLSDGAAGRS